MQTENIEATNEMGHHPLEHIGISAFFLKKKKEKKEKKIEQEKPVDDCGLTTMR